MTAHNKATVREAGIISGRVKLHRQGKRSLASYRQTTPAPAVVKQASRQISSDSYYAAKMQARVEHEIRLEKYAEIQRIAAEPKVLRRWERQWLEIQEISREARNARV